MKAVTLNVVLAATALLSSLVLTASAAPATNLVCNGCVSATDLHSTAKPAGADFTAPVNNSAFTAETVITSITLNLPGPGIVIVNSGGFAIFNDNPSGVDCAITRGTTVFDQPHIAAQNHNALNARRMPIASTRGFRETSGGPKTYHLVCYPENNADLEDVILTAVFVPRRY